MLPYLFLVLDVPDAPAAQQLVAKAGPNLTHVQIGLQLFMAEGPTIVRLMNATSKKVLLNLNFHDTPEIVQLAAKEAASMPGVEFITVHTGGGLKMMQYAVAGVQGTKVQVLGVTVLTSMEQADLAQVGTITDSVQDLVVKRALLAREAGCHGVIASPEEVYAIRKAGLGKGFMIFTTDVRSAGDDHGDQKQIGTTAHRSIYSGANGIIVGRPISDAPRPALEVDTLIWAMKEAASHA